MATLPLSYTKVKILSGVKWSNDYKHTRMFGSKEEQLSYFNGKPIIYENSNHVFSMNKDKHIIAIGGGIYDKLLKANYLMFQNSEYADKWFYCFVTKIERVNSQVTNIHFELDLYQTWFKDFTFNPSFVVREHCQLWNEDGSPVINTIDEGLNYGLEYDDVHIQHFVPNQGIKFLVIISTKSLHDTDKGKAKATYNGLPQPLTYYVLPIMLNGEPIVFINSKGEDFAMASPEKFLSSVYKEEENQKAIVSIFITESIGCPFTLQGGGESPLNISFTEKDQKISQARIGDATSNNDVLWVEDVNRYMTETYELGGKYENLPSYKESKLYMYPYTILTIDDFRGNRVDYKLEYIYDSKINLNIKGSMGTSNKVSHSIQKYNDKSNMTNHQDNQYGTIDNNPNDIPVITDLLAAYLQGHKNSIAKQEQSIAFNGLMNGLGSIAGKGVPGTSTSEYQDGGGIISGIQGQGNTILQLQQIEAKQKDIGNIPPQITKQGSNSAYDMGHRYDGITLIKKTLKPEYYKKLNDFFNMFGYKKNEVKVPFMNTRKNWNYVQTTSCNITGDFNHEDLQGIKSIFDSGITLWHTDEIGNYSLDNSEI